MPSKELKKIFYDFRKGPTWPLRSTASHEKKTINRLRGYIISHTDDKTLINDVMGLAFNSHGTKLLRNCCDFLRTRLSPRVVTEILKFRQDNQQETQYYDLLVLLECGFYNPTFWQLESQVSERSCSLSYVAKLCLETDDVKSMESLESATGPGRRQLVRYIGIDDVELMKSLESATDPDDCGKPLLWYSFGDYLPNMIKRHDQRGDDDPALMRFLLEHGVHTSPTIVTDAIRLSFRHLQSLIISMGEHGRMKDLQGVDDKGRTPLRVAELYGNETGKNALNEVFSTSKLSGLEG